MTKEFENKIQEIIDEACDKCEYSTDGGESLFLENQVKDIVKKSIEALWHKPDEDLYHGKEVLIEYGNYYHDVGFYDEESNSIQIGIEEYVEMANIKRLVYLLDLTDF